MPYTAYQHPRTPSADELRERIPGWGADLDPADRPSFPKEVDMRGVTGAHWERPEQQRPEGYRERSIEHARLPAVFGTAQPLHGVSGAIRRVAYERFSEGRAAHWLLLVVGDRVEMFGDLVRAAVAGRPDDPLTETGILVERGTNPVAARRSRIDTRHAWIDPILAAGPWLLGGLAVFAIVRGVVRGRR